MSTTKTFIKVRTQFEGFHFYPNASKIDPRIEFLEKEHRHIFHVDVKISVTHDDRELEFFLCRWKLNEFIRDSHMNHKSCEMIAKDILAFMKETYGERYYEIVVSEDRESDGIVEYTPSALL